MQFIKNHVIAAAADGHNVLQAATFSETHAPVGCKGRYPWHRPRNSRSRNSRSGSWPARGPRGRAGELPPGDVGGRHYIGAQRGTGRLAVAGDRRAAGALGDAGDPAAPPGRGGAGAPGRPWSRYDDARTAVVRDILRTVISALAAQAGRNRLDILDAGGGTGGFAVPLAGLGHNVTVIDPSPDSLAAAERRAAEMNVALSVAQGDVTDLTMMAGEASVDLVLCHSVLEYVDSPADAMASIAQVLRPAGAVSVLAASSVAAVIHRA